MQGSADSLDEAKARYPTLSETIPVEEVSVDGVVKPEIA